MVRIRKKTSNRGSTNQRAKIKKKVKESRKKAKKDAKKNPQHKSKKKKDPGIPNNFPFKDQILAEVAQARRQAQEEKQRRKDEKKQAATTHTQDDVETDMAGIFALAVPATNAPTAAMEVDEVPLLIDTTVPNLKAALDTADVVVHILDARDPLSFRSAFVERESKSKKQIFVLNKIDRAPKEGLEHWAKILRVEHPTFFFRSASSFITSETLPVAAIQTKGKSRVSADDAVGIEPLLDYLHSLSNPSGPVLTIALVGVTNSGKSALLNSLLCKNAVQVYNPTPSPSLGQKRGSIMDAPSTTLHPQSLTLTYRKTTFKFVDTPGLNFIPTAPTAALSPSSTSDAEDEELRRQTRLAHDILLRNRGNISKLHDPLPAASYIFHRASLADLLILFNLPAVPEGDLGAFLGSLARREGALHRRGAVVDLVGAGRALVRDWKSGRLAWYTLPSSSLGKREEAEADRGRDREATVDEKLRAIYARDEKVLAAAGVLPRKEIRRTRAGLVQLACGKVDERGVDMEAIVEVESDSDEDAEIAFEPSIKGGILKASKGKKKQPEPERDETEDDPSGEDTEEDEEGASGSEEDDEVDLSEGVEVLPVQSTKLSGKRKRDARKEDKDEERAKKVRFEPHGSTKSVSKSKPTAAARKNSAAKGNGVSVSVKKAGGDEEYDFSRYF